MEKIKSIEIVFKNVIITPIIIAKVFLGQKSSSKAHVPLSLKVKFFMRGLKSLILIKVGFINKIDVLFVTSNHYEVEEEEILFDKFITPFINYLEIENKQYKIARYTNAFTVPKNYFKLKNVLHLQEAGIIYSKIKGKQTEEKISFDVEEKRFLETVGNQKFDRDCNPFDIEYIQLFISLKNLFKIYLEKSKAQHIVVVCYYDLKSFAMVRAANELGISIIDLQHGVQGKGHFAYNYWPEHIIKTSLLFPTHFWCWDNWSADVIKSWFPKKQNVITGYNSWMQERKKSEVKSLIVFTAQPLDNAVPELIVEAITNYKGKLKWCIRLHPHQINELAHYKEFLLNHQILDKIEFEAATSIPLSELLNKTHIHITDYSSVVLEAMWYGIPSVIISERGMQYYNEQVPEHMLVLARDRSTVLDAINKIEEQWEFSMYKDSKKESFDSLANKFFKYNG